jgi:hypothetical protein
LELGAVAVEWAVAVAAGFDCIGYTSQSSPVQYYQSNIVATRSLWGLLQGM